jgi:ABC-type uncharacterized transport system permease subunit
MVYEAFDTLAAAFGAVWDWAGSADPHHAFIAGVVIWFLVERLLGFVATPIFKAASITIALILMLLATGLAQTFSKWTEAGGSRPAIARGAAETNALKDAGE